MKNIFAFVTLTLLMVSVNAFARISSGDKVEACYSNECKILTVKAITNERIYFTNDEVYHVSRVNRLLKSKNGINVNKEAEACYSNECKILTVKAITNERIHFTNGEVYHISRVNRLK